MTIISTDAFLTHPDVIDCLNKLKKKFGYRAEKFVVLDVIDSEGNQYVNLVQNGGGLLGLDFVGYTYILEQMSIRFIRLAGTCSGTINTALVTVIGGGDKNEKVTAKDDKKRAKSVDILKAVCDLFF